MATAVQHQNFIDWMKALGMLLIIIGHVVGDPFNMFNEVSQPVYTKQLGVAFFVFIMGWSLANDSRPGIRVLFNRLFPIYFYGVLFAVLLSVIFFFTKNDINESNYLPFFLGLNVFLNFFPANPTTWYIGTYIHLLLLWYFLMRNRKVGKKDLLLAFIIENMVRTLLISSGNNFIAYMFLPNWLTVFLLGMYLHQKRDKESTITYSALLVLVWLGMLFIWSFSGSIIGGFDKSFPFRALVNEFSLSIPFRSILISLVYTINTLIFFEIARRLPGLRSISFFARNTLIIFIAHMPVKYELSPFFYSLFETPWLKRVSLIIILFVGIAALSEIIQKAINLKSLREFTWTLFTRVTKTLK